MSVETVLQKYDDTIRVVSREFGKYNDSLFEQMPFAEWKNLLVTRSAKTRELYFAYKETIDELRSEVIKDLSDEEMDAVYDYVYKIRKDFNLQDPPIYSKLIKMLISHYEEKQDYPKLAYLYTLYWQTVDEYYVKAIPEKASEIIDIAKKAVRMALKNVDILKKAAADEENPGYLMNPFVLGINYISEHSKDAPSQMEAVEQYYDLLEKYYILVKGEKILEDGLADIYMDILKSKVLGLFYQVLKYHEDELSDYFDFFKKKNITSNDEYVNILFLLENDYFYRRRDESEIVKDLEEMYFKTIAKLIKAGKITQGGDEGLRDQTLGLMYVLMIITDKSNLDRSRKREIIRSVSDEFMKYISSIAYEDYNLINSYDECMLDLFEYNFKYARGAYEKEEIVMSYLVRRQPITFIHSLMVQRIASLITVSLLKTNRELFAPLKHVKLSTDEGPVDYAKESDFDKAVIKYVEKAAFYHDLGKCAVSAVINMQVRPLFDDEFEIIKMHPIKNREVLHDDPDFGIYSDVMCGHHKSFDGKSGYPASFDGTASPYKIIIDIVSIADTIDAATDILGRNYAKGKNFAKVFEEMIEGSGRRYNGQIISVLGKDVDLRNTLSRLTGAGRFDIYYNAYHHVEDTAARQKKTKRKKLSLRARMNVLFMAFLLVGGGTALIFHFIRNNSNRETITRQNEEYLSDATILLSDYVDNTLYEAAKKLKSLSGVLSKMYAGTPGEDINTYLETFNDQTVFDYIEYASSDGTLHSLGENSVCRDEEWFRSGMSGGSGYTYVERTPVTGKPAIIFYEPVKDSGRVVGVLVGRYDKIRVKEILNAELFGIYPETLLLNSDGDIIVSTGETAITGFAQGLDAGLKDADFVKGTYEGLEDFLRDDNTSEVVMRYRDEDGTTIISVSRVGRSDWFILQIFPSSLNSSMTEGLNRFNTMSSVSVLFIIFTSFTLVMMTFYRQREKLEKAVEDATAEKERLIFALKDANTRAVEAASDATAASKAKSEFLASMSHELRTPMNAVIGMTEVMLREEHSNKDTAYLKNIKNSGHALLQIINDILDFSKIESGKMELIEDEYDLPDLMDELSMIFTDRIGSKDIKLIYELDPDIPRCMIGDSARVRQILINIVNNAIKFTEHGFIRVKVDTETSGEDEYTVNFAVRDTGIGIRPEDKAKLFGSFTRLDQKKNSGIEGSGLGLSITKRLVNMMGGEIDVESTYGEGSEFIFSIKQKRSEHTVVQKPSGELEEIKFTAPDAKILLAEDIDMNVKVAFALLEPFKFKMDVAENGKVALEMVQKEHYDLVLMDHMMPVMDGIEATEAIRRLNGDEYKKLPIIALSANIIESVRKSFYDAGMNDFVSKPIDMKEISNAFIKWLPPEKIKYLTDEEDPTGGEVSEERNTDVPEGFPEELDKELAMKSSYTKEILLDNLKNFYLMIDSKAAKIEDCLKDDMIKDYTIEVHGLKNTARYIGAADLSKWFERMETAGNAYDTATIHEETPKLLEEFKRFKNVLKDFADSDEGLPAIDITDLTDMMNVIAESVDAFDFATVDSVIGELKKFSVPDEIKDIKDKLILDVSEVKADAVKEDAEEILKYCGRSTK